MKPIKAFAITYKGKISDIYMSERQLKYFLTSPSGMLCFQVIKEYEVKEIEIIIKDTYL